MGLRIAGRLPACTKQALWCILGDPGCAGDWRQRTGAASPCQNGDNRWCRRFLRNATQRGETLEQNQPQNPPSVELLVNSAKRYLAKPEHRIQLDDLFAQETERLLEQLDEESFPLDHPVSAEDLRSRVQRYESIPEPMARMAGVLGRWGNGNEFTVVQDILQSLYEHAGRRSSERVNRAWG